MKKTNNKYLLFGLIGLVVIGAVVVLSQNSGQMFQGALIPRTTTYSTISTITLDSVNKEVQALKSKVATMETRILRISNAVCLSAEVRSFISATNVTDCSTKLLNYAIN